MTKVTKKNLEKVTKIPYHPQIYQNFMPFLYTNYFNFSQIVSKAFLISYFRTGKNIVFIFENEIHWYLYEYKNFSNIFL